MRTATAATLLFALTSTPVQVPTRSPAVWMDTFTVKKSDLHSTGRNAHFVLEPGHQLVLEGGDRERLVISVLDQTEIVDGVETRVVEERETRAGRLVEVSRNFFAISSANDVYYFGEDVDVYKDGNIAGHEGAWRSGVNGARFGLMMPAVPRAGARYYQEVAPGIAMDRAEIVSVDAVMTTPAGRYTKVVKIEETTPLEPGAKELKHYADGVGLIADGALRLVKATPARAR